MQNMARSPAGARIDRLCTWAATSAADVELELEFVVERDSVLADQRDARLDSAPASSAEPIPWRCRGASSVTSSHSGLSNRKVLNSTIYSS